MTDLHKPGTRVTYRGHLSQHEGRRFLVLNPAAFDDPNISNDGRRHDRNFVRDVETGIRWWFKPEELVPDAQPAPEFPVGATVLHREGGWLGRVVAHRTVGNLMNPTVAPVVQPSTGRSQAAYPDTTVLERVHILTHEELTELDELRTTDPNRDVEKAIAILDKHLRPTVTRTFTVTVTAPTGQEPSADEIATQLKQDPRFPTQTFDVKETN